jgi:tRNA (guanine-N7-)-methyltransferase
MPFFHVDIFDDLPLRLKDAVNPYAKRLTDARKTADLPLKFGSELCNMKGEWRKYFETKMQPPIDRLILEIGIHKGKVMLELAQDHPHTGVIGMDITMKRVVLSADVIKNKGLKNSVVLLGNAKFLSQIFDTGELDGILIFFPDPWTKKSKQLNKRLMNPEFCSQVASVLRTGGFFWLKTDCSSYFEETLSHLKQLGFEQSSSPIFSKPYESTFESRFKDKGQITYEDTFLKVGPKPTS